MKHRITKNYLTTLTKLFASVFFIVILGVPAKAQIITTVAGNGIAGSSGNGGQATAAELQQVAKTCLDDSGNIYIVSSANNVVQKVSALTGIITVVAGNGNSGFSGDGGPATAAELSAPSGVAIDDSGNIFISDYNNHRVRKVNGSTQTMSTIVGNNTWAYSGDGGLATAAQLSLPTAVTLDDSGNIYIADQWNFVIRKITKKTGVITTVAGNNSKQFSFSGNGGPATDAALYLPSDVAVDDSGNIYIADEDNNEIREVSKKTGIINDYAGSESGTGGYSGVGGPATTAEIDNASGVGIDDSGNIFIADGGNSVVYEVSAKTGILTLVAGNYALGAGYTGDNRPATTAQLNGPNGVSIDKCGNFYIADDGNNVVRKVTVENDSVKVLPLSPTVCSGSSDTLTASGAGTYSWSPSTGLSDTTGSVVIANPTITTTYVISGTGICSGTATSDTIVVTVTVAGPLTVTQQPSQPTCSGQSVTLAISGGGSNFTWSPSTGLSATTGSSVTATPSVTTTYTVEGANSGGCSSSGTDIDTIIPSQPLIVLPQPGPLFCSGLSAELKVQGGGSNFIWTPTTGLSDTTSGDSVLAAPLVTTTYYVSGYDSLGCLSSGTEVVAVIASPNKPTFYQHGDTLTSSSTTDNQWYMDGQPLNGDTSQNLVINNTSPDSFYVVVENEANGCSTSSDTVTTTGINQVSAISNQLSIYPNPFNNEICITISSSALDVKDWNLQIINVLGQTVYSRQSLNYNNGIDLSNLPGGVYFITVINKTGKAVVPVVKQ